MAPKDDALPPLAASREPTMPFSIAIGLIESGQLHDDASEALRELNEKLSEVAARAGSAKGELTLKLTFKLKGGHLTVNGDVTTKTPKPPREDSVFWLTAGNNLSQDNPKQLPLTPRRVEAPAAPVRDVGAPRKKEA